MLTDDFDELWDDEDRNCWYCGGDGWGIRGTDWDNDDPVNFRDGEVERCPNCNGSGLAKDCTFW
jgi:hypothetical protein